MSWYKDTLGNVSEKIQTGPFGSQLHQSDYRDEGVPVIMPKDMLDGRISILSIARISEEHVERLKQHKVKSGDIVYSRRGDVGKCALITDKEENWLCGTGCLKVTLNPKKIIPKFAFYQLQRKESIGWLINHAVGSTMLNLNTSILTKLPIEITDLDKQQSIVNILASYDNLIENNQKQIKLLEEAAQRLYKEWFIDLRFPGHENVEVVDGVPEGWNIGVLSDIGTFKRGKTITKAKIVEGEVPVISGGLGPAYYHNESNTSSPVITVSGSGANAGFTRLYYTEVFASDCSFVDIEQIPYLYWIYLFLKNNSSRLDMLQKGSAQPHVYAKDINALECVIPIKEVLNLFCEVVGSYFNKIGILEQQIIRLTEARDRLLPKLMSGEIEV